MPRLRRDRGVAQPREGCGCALACKKTILGVGDSRGTIFQGTRIPDPAAFGRLPGDQRADTWRCRWRLWKVDF